MSSFFRNAHPVTLVGEGAEAQQTPIAQEPSELEKKFGRFCFMLQMQGFLEAEGHEMSPTEFDATERFMDGEGTLLEVLSVLGQNVCTAQLD